MVISFRVFSKKYLPMPVSTKISSCGFFFFSRSFKVSGVDSVYKAYLEQNCVIKKVRRHMLDCSTVHCFMPRTMYLNISFSAQFWVGHGKSEVTSLQEKQKWSTCPIHWGFLWVEVMRGRHGSADGIQPPCPALSVPVFLSESVCLWPAATPAPPDTATSSWERWLGRTGILWDTSMPAPSVVPLWHLHMSSFRIPSRLERAPWC